MKPLRFLRAALLPALLCLAVLSPRADAQNAIPAAPRPEDFAAVSVVPLDAATETDTSAVSGNQAQIDYVTDTAGILSDTEQQSLNDAARQLSEDGGFGFYVVTIDDYSEYGNSIEDVAELIYDGETLGYGAGHDGILLLLSMSDRTYDLDAFGYGNTAFTDYGKERLADTFLDNFRNDDWYGGFYDYIHNAADILAQSQEGSPLDVPSQSDGEEDWYVYEEHRGPGLFTVLIFIVALPCLISALICGGLMARVKTVRHATRATAYTARNGFFLRASSDQYTHTTESRVKIERHEDHGGGGGGTTISDSGHSHSSGSF